MPLINKMGRSTCIYSYTKKGAPRSDESGWNRFAWLKNINKRGDFNQEKGSKATQET